MIFNTVEYRQYGWKRLSRCYLDSYHCSLASDRRRRCRSRDNRRHHREV